MSLVVGAESEACVKLGSFALMMNIIASFGEEIGNSRGIVIYKQAIWNYLAAIQ